eukprot:TRINITY_DN5467_c0_g1_i2.p1 TRINITY_DN5467_c0_g1~~TRINITY_DN5467_c0_g1_i2.p1  ORF type:complete len:200 (-),score=37.27 TRINITY_DN5467_c0_g1_i2:108-707(-)
MKSFWLLFVLISASSAAVTRWSDCPDLTGIPNFQLARYLGVWYEYANVFEVFQAWSTCGRVQYSDRGVKVGVVNEQINYITQNYGNVTGAARPAVPGDPENKADFIVAFDNIPFQDSESDEGGVPNYRVVATDYDNFAVVYNCKSGYIYNSESLWVLTREQFPDQQLVDDTYSLMKNLTLPVKSLEKTPQEDCQKMPPL